MHSKHRIYWIVRIINAYRSKVPGIEHLSPSSFALKGDLFLHLLPIDLYLLREKLEILIVKSDCRSSVAIHILEVGN
jgi:hypothetical protein